MRITRQVIFLVVYLGLCGIPGSAVAKQNPPPQDQTPASLVTREQFTAAWERASKAHQGELERASGADARKAVYRKILSAFVRDEAFTRVRQSPQYDAAMRRLVDAMPDSATAQSTNSPLTNPASNELIERTGATQLIALAADFRKLFAADESAVSLNLNAIALVGGGKDKDRTAQWYYARHEGLRRLTGTVTFGAKVPEKEITGLSGIPSADTLFDAISWDVKLRLIGDRDPLASKWRPLMIGAIGQQLDLLVRVQGIPVSPEDVVPLRDAALEVFDEDWEAAKDRIASSLQVSVMGSGVHLTNEEGKNKYSVVALLDKGFTGLDLTANLSYNVANVTEPGATDPFKSKDFQLSAGLVGSFLKDRIVNGRFAELSASLQGKFFVDGSEVPIDRKNIFNLNATLSIPFQLKAKIPVSITWTNDPNSLKKEKYVTGQIGVSYDLGALKDSLKLK